MSILAGGYKPGDWVLVVPSPGDDVPAFKDPPHGSVVRVLGPHSSSHHPIIVAWDSGYDGHGLGRWPMCLSQIRPATREELAKAQLTSLDGL